MRKEVLLDRFVFFKYGTDSNKLQFVVFELYFYKLDAVVTTGAVTTGAVVLITETEVNGYWEGRLQLESVPNREYN